VSKYQVGPQQYSIRPVKEVFSERAPRLTSWTDYP